MSSDETQHGWSGDNLRSTRCQTSKQCSLDDGSQWWRIPTVWSAERSGIGIWILQLCATLGCDGKVGRVLCHRLRWTKQFGHMRLAQTRYLQVRERTREGHVKVLLVRSKNSPVDLFMQAVSGTLREQRLKVLAARACQCVQETQGSSVELNDGPSIDAPTIFAGCCVRSAKSLKAVGCSLVRDVDSLAVSTARHGCRMCRSLNRLSRLMSRRRSDDCNFRQVIRVARSRPADHTSKR